MSSVVMVVPVFGCISMVMLFPRDKYLCGVVIDLGMPCLIASCRGLHRVCLSY